MSFGSIRRSSLVTSAIILLFFVSLLSFTQVSPRASLAAPQTDEPTFTTTRTAKRSRAQFVPGNVIVRYRDEAAAKRLRLRDRVRAQILAQPVPR